MLPAPHPLDRAALPSTVKLLLTGNSKNEKAGVLKATPALPENLRSYPLLRYDAHSTLIGAGYHRSVGPQGTGHLALTRLGGLPGGRALSGTAGG